MSSARVEAQALSGEFLAAGDGDSQRLSGYAGIYALRRQQMILPGLYRHSFPPRPGTGVHQVRRIGLNPGQDQRLESDTLLLLSPDLQRVKGFFACGSVRLGTLVTFIYPSSGLLVRSLSL